MRIKVTITDDHGYHHEMVTTLDEMGGPNSAYSQQELNDIRACAMRGEVYRRDETEVVKARFAYERA